jgi:hypothetical protein
MKSEGLTVVNCSTARMKKNQNLFTRSVPPLLFVLIVSRSSQYDLREGLRLALTKTRG